jgi:hypothetical protein
MKCRWNRIMLNVCGIVVTILKMATARNFWMSGINSGHHNQCRESNRDIIINPHMKCRWNRTMLNLCGIVAAILKMATGRNFSMSWSNSGHHYLPTYNILMISDNVEFLKTQNCSSNGDLSLCQILCLYHYPFRSYQH